MAALSPVPGQQYFDDNGDPLSGGKLWTYQTGTTTPKTAYQDQAGTVAHANPIILDSVGRIQPALWISSDGEYTYRLLTSADVFVDEWDDVGTDETSLQTDLSDTTLVGNGDGLIGVKRTGGAATTLHAWIEQQVFNVQSDFGATADGATDDTTAVQSAVTAANAAGGCVFFPQGTYKVTSSLSLSGGVTVRGANPTSTTVSFYGSAGFVVAGDLVCISDMQIREYTSGGAADPRANVGINCTGTSGTKRFYFRGENLYLRGWVRAIDFQYTWNSALVNVATVNCTKALRLFGQSVNNTILGGNFTTVGGSGTITFDLVPDSSNVGEGLMIHGALIGSAEKAIVADTFLLCTMSGCIVDDVSGAAITIDNAAAFNMIGGYIFSAAGCVQINSRGPLTEILAAFIGVSIRSGAGTAFNVDGNNRNIRVIGCEIRYDTSAFVCASTVEAACMIGCHGIQEGAGTQVSLGGSGNVFDGNTGDLTLAASDRSKLTLAAASTWNPTSLSDDVSVTSPAITVTGAVVGDVVDVYPPASPSGFLVYGLVDTNDNVKITAHNVSGGSATPPNGSWVVRVRKS